MCIFRIYGRHMYSNFTQAQNTDEMAVDQELEGDAGDSIAAGSHAFEQPYCSFLDLPQNNEVSYPPTSLLALEPETQSPIVRVAHPWPVMRTPSPLSSFDSSLQISSPYSPQYYSQLAQLTATQTAIVSSLYQPQGDDKYGVRIAHVYERVRQVIPEITQEEFR
jgi:hypothetical protein